MRFDPVFYLQTYSLPHVIAVIGDDHRTVDPGHLGKNVDKIGIILFQTNLDIHFDCTPDGRFALDRGAGHILGQKLSGSDLRIVIGAVEHHHIWMAVRLLIDKHQQNQPDADAANHRQRNHACRKDDACTNRPEQKGNIQRVLDCGTKTHDGQRADHTKGKNHIGGDCQNDDGGNHRQGHQRRAEAGGIHHTAVGLFVDEKDKQTDAEGQHDGQQHIQDADGGYIFQKAGFKNILKSHSKDYSFFVVLFC